MLRSNPNVSNSDVPYCYLSRLESSYGELTIGCNLKNMVCLICSTFMLLYQWLQYVMSSSLLKHVQKLCKAIILESIDRKGILTSLSYALIWLKLKQYTKCIQGHILILQLRGYKVCSVTQVIAMGIKPCQFGYSLLSQWMFGMVLSSSILTQIFYVLQRKDEWLSAEQDILLGAARIIKSHGIELGSTMQCC